MTNRESNYVSSFCASFANVFMRRRVYITERSYIMLGCFTTIMVVLCMLIGALLSPIIGVVVFIALIIFAVRLLINVIKGFVDDKS